jgi:hypothetical protein
VAAARAPPPPRLRCFQRLVTVRCTDPRRHRGLLELALELEYRAHDLYRGLALRDASTPEQQETFLELAHQEKRYVEGLLRGLGELAAV